MPLAVVVGLAAEARIARRLGNVAIAGGRPDAAAAAAERLVADGATALLSFGLAGGLDPNLAPGDVVVPVAVLDAGRRYFTDEDLCRALGGATVSVLLAGEAVVADALARRLLSARTGASAVDLESGAVARVAAGHRLPFAVLRAVCVPAQRSMPPAALGNAGAIRPLSVLGSIVTRPWQVPALLRLALDTARARHALARSARTLLWHLDGTAGS
jgi:adenosylhomocysteine nucleosidase